MRFHDKYEALMTLKPNVAVISEAACPEILMKKGVPLEEGKYAWVGDKPNKGLLVLAFGDYALQRNGEVGEKDKLFLPLRVTGPTAFSLLAVWCFNYRITGTDRAMPGPLFRLRDSRPDLFNRDDLVVAGDFNNHVCWDTPRGKNRFRDIDALLQEAGLASAYHRHHGVGLGEEEDPTIYWRKRKKDGPSYHIDYVYAPERWLGRMTTFEVGSHGDWVGSGLSDHVPLVAGFAV
jgi:exodeoxyribonuclease-3